MIELNASHYKKCTGVTLTRDEEMWPDVQRTGGGGRKKKNDEKKKKNLLYFPTLVHSAIACE